MKKLARSIAIFLITTYIDAVYRYSCRAFLVGAGLPAIAEFLQH
jgi:hypothetical protein